MSPRLIILITITLLVVSLAGAVQYYRAQALAGKVKITSLNAQVTTLSSANASLKNQALQVKSEVERYVEAVNKMGEANTGLNARLQSTRAKLAQHKLLKLRQSRHSELVLKIINKSIAKSQKEWMQ